MTKLTDTQLVVLSAASNREDGSILPLPPNLKGGAAAKVVDGLLRRGLAERVKSDRAAVPDLVRVTPAGLKAIGVDSAPPAEASAPVESAPAASPRGRRKVTKAATRVKPAPKSRKSMAKGRQAKASRQRDGGDRRTREGTKQALLIDMLRRKDGATVEQIVEATGWQRHTVRGAIAGALKKKLGLAVESEKVEGRGRVYKIVS